MDGMVNQQVRTGNRAVRRLGIVDDDMLTLAAMRAIIDRKLSEDGVHVLWAVRSGNEAVNRCVHQATRPDAVVVDMGMDEVDGESTLRRIGRCPGNILLLAMTSHSLSHYQDAAMDAGAMALFDKADIECWIGRLRDLAHGTGIPTSFKALGNQKENMSDRDPLRSRFSPREEKVMNLTVEGMTAREVAASLGLSEPTVKTHIRNVVGKLGARNKLQAIIIWMRLKDDCDKRKR